MSKVTAIVPTYNEEARLEKCLQSLTWADELLVVDSFSTDRTLEIAQNFNARIIQHEYINSAAQKNWIIPQTTHDWIFLLDADEYVLPEMAKEIQEKLKSPRYDAYWVKRKNFFMGKRIRFSGWQGDKVIRLFRKDLRYEPKHVHSEIQVRGEVDQLKNFIFHNSYLTLEHYLAKINRYASWGALDRLPHSAQIGFFHLFIKPAFRFIQFFFFRLGFLDGIRGYMIASFAAYSVYLRSVKLLELQRKDRN